MTELWRQTWAANAGIRSAVWVHLALLVFALVALPGDKRQILGLNPWIKPIKFDLSVLLFLLTIGLLLSGLQKWSGQRAAIGWGIGVAMIVENCIISLQSLRGVRSHMNFATLHDALLFGVMGLFIALSTVLVGWLLALYSAGPTTWPAAVAWGARLGLTLLIAGSLEGSLMVGRFQAHTVGAPDGGAGLPFLNWSTGHGDLRVAHFFALHALQLLMLLGWAISRTRWPQQGQIAAVVTGAAAYTGLVWMLFKQALAGRPLLS